MLSAFLGAVGGPLAYWAGVRLGAASFGFSLPFSLLVLGMVWAFVLPISMKLAQLTDLNPVRKGSSEGDRLIQGPSDDY